MQTMPDSQEAHLCPNLLLEMETRPSGRLVRKAIRDFPVLMASGGHGGSLQVAVVISDLTCHIELSALNLD